jgi:uncharacterized protein (TIGR02757 family)
MKPKKPPPTSLRRKLDELYERYSREEFLRSDPVGALDRTLAWEDLEMLSFVVAGLSYGRVENIYRSYAAVLARLTTLGLESNGRGLAFWMQTTPPEKQRTQLEKAFKGWVHRLNSAEDLRDVFLMLATVRRRYGSLAEAFLAAVETGISPKDALVGFCANLATCVADSAPKRRAPKGGKWRGTGASWFFANPLDGSTCKRLVMWMRWMIRKDSVDIGLWQERFASYGLQEKLFWPVDTHIHQWALAEGITTRKSVNWAFVEELTQWGRDLCPEDPVRYDFVLCQSGMQGFRRKR